MYKSCFLINEAKKWLKIFKKSNRPSNAPKETKSFFDLEAKQSNVSSEEDENDDDENNEDSDNEESDSEDNVENVDNIDKEKQLNERKRKSEFSELDSNLTTKKNSPTMKWLPNGNKVINF